jgi:general secretion pathway protein I
MLLLRYSIMSVYRYSWLKKIRDLKKYFRCRFKKETTQITDATGFTLLEVMIAMAILAIALVAVFQSQSQSISMVGQSRFETTAALLAQSKMATVDAMKTGNITSDNGTFDDDFPDYTWTVEVSDTASESVKKISVTIVNKQMTTNNTYTLVLYKFAKK